MAEKLIATVLGITDLGGSEQQIELDIQVQQGELCLGRCVRLSGPSGGEEIEFRSCYLTPKRRGPHSATIICSRPKSLTIPTGDLAGWTITEL
jgi:hypothetical protein